MGSSTTTTQINRVAGDAAGAGQRARWHRRASGLYEDLRGPARALVRRAYGSTFGDDEIEDIYSSAWLGTLRALERKQERLSDDEVRSYLLTAVANHASKEIRRRRRKPVAPLEAAGSVADVGDGPDDALATAESRRLTRDLLASLPPRRRAVMLLRYGWGLEPSEVCGMVAGLSPRAYRKEVTRGVEELTRKMRLVEDGGWCADREPLIRAYASGIADRDQELQARQHLEHCRHCADFAGKLGAQLQDLGAGLVVPGALEALDGRTPLADRVADALDRFREGAGGILSRDGGAELASSAASVRGAGATGAGVVAKLAGIGATGKAAIACLGGGAALTVCVAAGVVPLPERAAERDPVRATGVERSLPAAYGAHVPAAPAGAVSEVTADPGPAAQAGSGDEPARSEAEPQSVTPLAPSTPPTEAEFGVASGAAPVSSPAPSSSATGSGGGAVAKEFGP